MLLKCSFTILNVLYYASSNLVVSQLSFRGTFYLSKHCGLNFQRLSAVKYFFFFWRNSLYRTDWYIFPKYSRTRTTFRSPHQICGIFARIESAQKLPGTFKCANIHFDFTAFVCSMAVFPRGSNNTFLSNVALKQKITFFGIIPGITLVLYSCTLTYQSSQG